MSEHTISENLARLQQAKSDIASAITAKGGTVNTGDGFEEFPDDIATIPSGGDSHFRSNVNVSTEAGAVITATRVSFVLKVYAPTNSALNITDGYTVLTGTGAGESTAVTFMLPLSGAWTVTAVDGSDTYTKQIEISEVKEYEMTVGFANIYGVEWAGTSSPQCTRTDDAALFPDPDPYVADGSHPGSSPFDNLMPWSGIVKETIDGDVFVKIPKFWFKITTEGTKRKIQIADKEADGFSVSPAHQDRGDGEGERDYIYVSRYHVSNGYKSISGVYPLRNMRRYEARTGCTGRGSGYCQFDMMTLITIWYLYLVEFAHWNSQEKIGYGCGNNSATVNLGASDTMPYHTGTMQSSRTTYGVGTQYRWIEDLWGNVADWVDGIYFSSANIYAIKNPANFSDSSGGTYVGTRPTSSYEIKVWKDSTVSGYEWFIYPSEVHSDSDYTTYCCDQVGYGSSGRTLCFGGCYIQSQKFGLFYVLGTYSSSEYSPNLGARLMYLPPNS